MLNLSRSEGAEAMKFTAKLLISSAIGVFILASVQYTPLMAAALKLSSSYSLSKAQDKPAPLTHPQTPILTRDQALRTDLLGLKMGASLAEVRATLLTNGFQQPDPETAILIGWGRAPVASTGFDCDSGNSPSADFCSEIGLVQDSGYLWDRLTEEGDRETALPLFYINGVGEQALIAVRYERQFAQAVTPRLAIASYLETYGPASSLSVSERHALAQYRFSSEAHLGSVQQVSWHDRVAQSTPLSSNLDSHHSITSFLSVRANETALRILLDGRAFVGAAQSVASHISQPADRALSIYPSSSGPAAPDAR